MVAADPLNPSAFHMRAGALYNLGQYAQAEAAERQAIALGPDLIFPRVWRALILMQMGRLAEAKAELEKLHSHDQALVLEAILSERQGNRAESNRLLKELQQRGGDKEHFQYAEVLAQQRRTDEAFHELDRAWDNRDDGLTTLKADKMLEPLRNDPRFASLERKIGFP